MYLNEGEQDLGDSILQWEVLLRRPQRSLRRKYFRCLLIELLFWYVCINLLPHSISVRSSIILAHALRSVSPYIYVIIYVVVFVTILFLNVFLYFMIIYPPIIVLVNYLIGSYRGLCKTLINLSSRLFLNNTYKVNIFND